MTQILEHQWSAYLRSIPFRLINERSGTTDFSKVKSHLEDLGPKALAQGHIAVHPTSADVAEEAATRLLLSSTWSVWTKRVTSWALASQRDWHPYKVTSGPDEIRQVRSTSCFSSSFSQKSRCKPTCRACWMKSAVHALEKHQVGVKCRVCGRYRQEAESFLGEVSLCASSSRHSHHFRHAKCATTSHVSANT